MTRFQSNIAFSYVPYVTEICTPLFNNTAISFFQFMKTFDDGSYMTLTSNGNWLDTYFNKQYYEISNFRQPSHTYKEQFLLTNSFNNGVEIVRNATDGYDIANCITLVEKEEGACEFYLFAAGKNYPNIIEFYINNMDFLKLFVFYFKDKANDLLKKHAQNKFMLPKLSYGPAKNEDKIISATAIANTINRYYLSGKHAGTYLTKRELDCLQWMSKGKSASEMGLILGMTERTAETHLYNIKQKLHCSKLTQIISEAVKCGLI